MKYLFLAGSVAALAAGPTLAGGFQLHLQGQKNIGMGHTGTGLALDPAAIYFNPGALSHIRENGVQLGASALIAKSAYLQQNTGIRAQSDNPLNLPFTGYFSSGSENNPLKIGLGVYTPYSSKTKWETGWVGQDLLTQSELSAVFIQPTVSWRLTDWLGAGAGFVYARGIMRLQRRFPRANADGSYGQLVWDGPAEGSGYNIGLYAKPTGKLSIGVSYRSKVEMKIQDGLRSYKDTPGSLKPQLRSYRFESTLPLPDNLTLGIGFMPTEKLMLTIDVQRVGWSAFKTLRFTYDFSITELPRNYKDTYSYHLGGQYLLTDNLALRLGGYYDKTPVSEGYITAENPDADAVGLSAGVGYGMGTRLQLDASFLYIGKKERTDLANLSLSQGGTYKTRIYQPGLALTYSFNPKALPLEPTTY